MTSDEGETPEDQIVDDMDRIAQQVTSGPKCRRCGFPMETGALRFWSGQPLTSELVWHDPGDDEVHLGPTVESLTWGALGRYHALRGFRCPECKLVELDYSRDRGTAPPVGESTHPG